MSIGLLFWILWIIGLIYGCGWAWKGALGGGLATWVLLGLLGWAAFGPPIHG
jgi:hypothetical protein